MGFLLTVLLAGTACGGGGGGTTGPAPSPTPLTASFIPVTNTPPSSSVAMAEGTKSGDVVTVRVNVAAVSSVYGAAFYADYDPAQGAFVGYTPGTILEQGGNAPTYQVDDDATRGRVTVGASRTGNVSGVNVTSSQTLVNLTFRVKKAGTSALSVQNPILYDPGAPPVPPQPIAGVTWLAGSLRGI